MILVVGAGGTLGSVLVEELAAAGHPVRAGSRDPSGLTLPRGASAVRLDVRDPASVRDALDGVDVVVASFHGVAPPTRDNHPGIVDGAGAQRLIVEAVSEGVGRFVLVSPKGAAADAPARFYRLKHQAEEHLRATDLSWTIVRAPAFMEVHALQLMGTPLLAGKSVRLIGPARTPIEWVAVRDVAAAIVASLEDPARERQVVEINSPRRHSRLEALEVLEQASGRRAKRSHLPRGAAKALQRVGGVFNTGLGYLLEAGLSEDELPGHPVPADIAIEAPTNLATIARAWAASSA